MDNGKEPCIHNTASPWGLLRAARLRRRCKTSRLRRRCKPGLRRDVSRPWLRRVDSAEPSMPGPVEPQGHAVGNIAQLFDGFLTSYFLPSLKPLFLELQVMDLTASPRGVLSRTRYLEQHVLGHRRSRADCAAGSMLCYPAPTCPRHVIASPN